MDDYVGKGDRSQITYSVLETATHLFNSHLHEIEGKTEQEIKELKSKQIDNALAEYKDFAVKSGEMIMEDRVPPKADHVQCD